jgi:tetratricopeptide (TPR) repeat protein/glutathione synthase/RimK-type ligase-like ATP-grasp enzyme
VQLEPHIITPDDHAPHEVNGFMPRHTHNQAEALPASIAKKLVALYRAGKWGALVVAADRATKRYPRHPLGWKAAGKARLHLHRAAEALPVLSQLAKLAPDDADAFNDLGAAQQKLGLAHAAITSYQRAVELNRHAPESHSNLGSALCDVRRFEEAASASQHAIDLDPTSPAAHNNLGNVFREMGRPIDAEACYRRSLALKPNTLETLINLGGILETLGRWADARASYQLTIHVHPGSGIAHHALGRLLSRLGEQDEEAARCLQRAIALNASNANTYAELGNILMRKQQVDAALQMFRHAQTLQPLMTWRANQEKAAFSALFLDTPMAGSVPVDYLAGRAGYDRHFHCVIPDTSVDIDLLRTKADVVFNMICNPEDGAKILQHAADLVQRLGRPTVNHPNLIMNTDRETIARSLADIPGCVVAKTVRVAGAALADRAAADTFAGLRMPQLVRLVGTHGGQDFEKCDTSDEIAAFVSTKPDLDYYLTEYIDYRSADGFFRKYRAIFIDGDILPYHLAIHDHWKVHHFRTDMAHHAWMRNEEARFLADMPGVVGSANQHVLRAIANATGLDYGGVDFGIDRNGRIVMFEANASMLIHDEKTDLFAYKNEYIARIKHAFDAMLARRRLNPA